MSPREVALGYAFSLLVFAFACWALIGWWQDRARQRKHDRELAEAQDELADSLARERAATQKAEGVHDSVAGILGERDHWKALYFEQVAGHGAAQALLMRAVGSYHRYTASLRQAVERAKTLEEAQRAALRQPQVNVELLQTIVDEFSERHPAPAPEKVQHLVDSQARETPTAPISPSPA